jgi:transposase-like protein
MMEISKRKHSGTFKSKVAVEAIREKLTIPEIAKRYSVHTSQVSKWKKQALDGMPTLLEKKPLQDSEQESLVRSLYEQIGQLKVELDWLSKKV